MHLLVLYQHYLSPGEPGFSRLNEYTLRWIHEGLRITVVASQVNYMTGKKNVRGGNQLINRSFDTNGVEVIRAYIPSTYQKSVAQKIGSLGLFTLSSTLAALLVDKPDVILASSPPLFMTLPALIINMIHKVPFVLDIRDLWPESGYALGVLKRGSLFAGMLERLEKVSVRRATAINALTPAFRDDLIARGLASSSKIHVIPNGVDLSLINYSEHAVAMRKEIGWEGRFVVLYSGAHGIANRLEQLIDAAELLKPYPEILIACIGDGICLSDLRKKAGEKGLDNICFYGPVSKEMNLRLVSAADACTAVLKRSDTFKKVYPNKVFEYMACGKPIIVAIDGAARDLVERAQAGLFVPPEDPSPFAEAVLALRQSPDRCSQMALNGREFVAKYFSLDGLYARMTELLRSVAALS